MGVLLIFRGEGEGKKWKKEGGELRKDRGWAWENPKRGVGGGGRYWCMASPPSTPGHTILESHQPQFDRGDSSRGRPNIG